MLNILSPVMATNTDGRLALFVLGRQFPPSVYHLDQVAPGNGWSDWIDFGYPPGVQLNEPVNVALLAIAKRADGCMEVFTIGSDSHFYHFVQAAPGNGWGQWQQFAGAPWLDDDEVSSQPAVAANANGQLVLFEIPSNDTLYIQVQEPSGNWPGGWTLLGSPGPEQLGGDLALPVAALNTEGRLEFFSIGVDGLFHIWQVVPNGGWFDWFLHGTPAGTGFSIVGGTPLALAPSADGRLELFAVGDDGNLYHLSQVAPSDGWSDWISHGVPQGALLDRTLALAPNTDGRLQLFALGQDGNLYSIWQVVPNGGWSDWSSFGAPAGVLLDSATIALAPTGDGRLELFVPGQDGNLYHIWQVAPSGSGWSPWFSHGQPPLRP